jgi:hypothetical protein
MPFEQRVCVKRKRLPETSGGTDDEKQEVGSKQDDGARIVRDSRRVTALLVSGGTQAKNAKVSGTN